MRSLAVLSSLAIFATALAAPNVEYSTPKPTPAPTAVVVSAAPQPTGHPTLDELRRRDMTPALQVRGILEGRQYTCPSGYSNCQNGYCCGPGKTCFGVGLCYDPSVDYSAQISSYLQEYTSVYSLDGYYTSLYKSYLSDLEDLYGTATANGYSYTTGNSFGASETDPASASTSTGGTTSEKKGTNVGMIVGIVVAVVVVIIIALAAWWFIRRSNKKKAALAVQQPLMTHAPAPPPTQLPMQSHTPAPMPPYSPGPYGQYTPPPAAGMPTDYKINPQPNQQPYGQNSYPNVPQYQTPPPPPPPPAVGIVEANGDSVYRPQQQLGPESQYNQVAPQYTPGHSTISPQSTGVASELGGQSMVSSLTTGGPIPGPPGPPPQPGQVYEMDSSNYRQY